VHDECADLGRAGDVLLPTAIADSPLRRLLHREHRHRITGIGVRPDVAELDRQIEPNLAANGAPAMAES
jgi:hypothetical protein